MSDDAMRLKTVLDVQWIEITFGAKALAGASAGPEGVVAAAIKRALRDEPAAKLVLVVPPEYELYAKRAAAVWGMTVAHRRLERYAESGPIKLILGHEGRKHG